MLLVPNIKIAKQIYQYLASTYPHDCAFELVKCDVSIARVVGLLSVALKATCLITFNRKLSVYYYLLLLLLYMHIVSGNRMFLLSLSLSKLRIPLCPDVVKIVILPLSLPSFPIVFGSLWGVGSNPTFGVSTAAFFRHCRLGWALGRFKHQCV